MLTMYDAVTVPNIPSSASYVAGYVGGSWPTYPELVKLFPHATILSIAPQASMDAECLDVEPYDASNSQVVPWVKRQMLRKVERPVIYSSASNMNAVIDELTAAGIKVSQVRLWSAHYAGEHVCGPATCRLVKVPCDGTQWTDQANGVSLDQSSLDDNFFTMPKPPVKITLLKVTIILPQLKLNDNNSSVKVLQALLNTGHDYGLTTDGVFGSKTKIALDDFQKRHNLKITGEADSATWSALMTGK